MTKEELIEFIQRLPDDALLKIEGAQFHVKDHFQVMGLKELPVATAQSTIEHHLTFSMFFHSKDKYFPDKYMDKNSGFHKDLFTNNG